MLRTFYLHSNLFTELLPQLFLSGAHFQDLPLPSRNFLAEGFRSFFVRAFSALSTITFARATSSLSRNCFLLLRHRGHLNSEEACDLLRRAFRAFFAVSVCSSSSTACDPLCAQRPRAGIVLVSGVFVKKLVAIVLVSGNVCRVGGNYAGVLKKFR